MESTKLSASSAAAELVFLPMPGAGHINPTVEFANLLTDRHRHLSCTIFIMHLPSFANATASGISDVDSRTHRRVRFVHLPPTAPAVMDDRTGTTSFMASMGALIDTNKQSLRDGVAKLIAGSGSSASPRLAGIVLDMFCISMVDVADEFGVPAYLFYTSSASILGLSLHLQHLYDDGHEAFSQLLDSDAEVQLPTFANTVHLGKLLPSPFTDPKELPHLTSLHRRYRGAKGILVNTFEELEPRAMKFLLEGSPGTPPVYPVGPVINLAGDAAAAGNGEEGILGWLDGQPPSSVVFLCFGSMGSFDAAQVREIARGLEQSGHRFLWSLRRPPTGGGIHPDDYPDPEEALPEGFLRRTAEVGRVIGWAPQAEVLSRAAVAGFVSHCGWNSVVESVWFGVPIATWPMYAEQQVNAFLVARELGMAAEITVEYRKDVKKGNGNFLVTGEEVERGIRRLMEEGSQVREKVRWMKEASRKAVGTDGSSFTWVGRFIEDMTRNMSS